MKLRICDNSMRIRLSRSEVIRLGEGKRVDQITWFTSKSSLKSFVEPSQEVTTPRAHYGDSTLAIVLPAGKARAWAGSEEITIAARQEVASGVMLQILVEKDFECSHSRAEGDTDRFPNPRHAARGAQRAA